MKDETVELAGRRPKTFGRRKVTPRACVADGKRHLRAFLSEVLEDLGFVTTECASADELRTVLASELPDLILLGIAADGIEPGMFLETLVREAFDGKVLAVGARESIIVRAVQQVGEEYGLAMLPPLTTPFAAETLRERVAMLLPNEPAPSPAVHVGEALHAGWLELWYQPRIDARTLIRSGAEALVRMRHPTWGVVPPAYFIPEEHDPHLRDLFRIRDRARHAGLALSAGAAEPGRSLDQFARVVSDGAAGRARSLPPHADASGVRRADDRDRQRRGDPRPRSPRRGRPRSAPAQYRPVDRQSRRQLAVADGYGQDSLHQAEGRPALRHRQRH
ncbi:CheY-like chemotaxis protein [Bradyrhizobium sp. LB9.1b]